jgi:hypothetical protein
MQLTPGTTINVTTTVTRQTLYDLVYNAIGATVQQSDLSSDVLPIMAQSSPPNNPPPGMFWFDQTDQLMKVFVDVIDDTGCSIWLSVGPDRFDVACLAGEPLPFGAALVFSGAGRTVQLPPDWPALSQNTSYTNMRFEHLKVVGFQNENNNADHTASTVASNSWFPMAVSGLVWAWNVMGDNTKLGFTGNMAWAGLPSSFSAWTGFSSYTAIRGGLVVTTHANYNAARNLAPLVRTLHQTCLRDPSTQWARVLFTVPVVARYAALQP